MVSNKELSLKQIQEKLDIDDVAARFFKTRAIDTEKRIDEFLNPTIDVLEDPHTIPGVYDVISKIEDHIDKENIITIYGDFDVDGTSATTIMYKALKKIYDTRNIHVLPANRYRDGYGLSEKSIDIMSDINTDLIITLDCGISNHDEIKYAQLNGMDVVVIDHHEEPNPPKVPFVDPKVQQGNYLEKELCAAGVAWRVCQALLGDDFKEVLDIVALATIADVVPLLGENRIIAYEGIKRIKNNQMNLGIEMLMQKFNINRSEIEASDIAYYLGPAINAAGRLGSPKPVIQILNTDNASKADELAFQLKNTNKRRKEMSKKILKKMKGKINGKANDYNVIIERGDILKGVVGLVAGNLKETYDKPSIVLDVDSGKGSARSIPPFNMYENLKICEKEGLLEGCGGHSMAAGLKVKPEMYWKFKERMNELAEGVEFEVTEPDMIVDPTNITMETITGINKLAPFGKDHPAPLFKAENVLAENVDVTYTGSHLTFDVLDKRCIAFGQGYMFKKLLNNEINIEYTPGYDTYDEHNNIQLIVRNIEVS